MTIRQRRRVERLARKYSRRHKLVKDNFIEERITFGPPTQKTINKQQLTTRNKKIKVTLPKVNLP